MINFNKIKSKILLPVGAVLTTASLTFSTQATAQKTYSVEEVNNEIVNVLKDFQNDVTFAKLAVKSLAVRPAGVESVQFESKLAKASNKVDEVVKLSLSGGYWNPFKDGVNPQTKVNLAGKFNFLKAMTAANYNYLIDALPEYASELESDVKDRYKDALESSLQIDKQDIPNTGLRKVSVVGSYKFNLDKLPKSKSLDEVEFTGINFKAEITPEGFNIELSLDSNPLYYAFNKDSNGLKEFVDGLLTKDPSILAKIKEFVGDIDKMASSIISTIEGGGGKE